MPHKKIREAIRKNAPGTIHKSKKFFSFSYPKLSFLFLSILFAYLLFSTPLVSSWILNLGKFSYLGALIAGIFLAFGFSAPFAIGFFISMIPENIILYSLVGGVGATMGDFVIFKTIKFSFRDEFEKLKQTKVANQIKKIVQSNPHVLIRHYLLYILAGIVIATPLPDEIGISMLAGLTTVKQNILVMMSFILHTGFVFLLFYFL